MKTVLKNIYLDVLHDIVDRYNNAYHRATKTKPKPGFRVKHSVNPNANFCFQK